MQNLTQKYAIVCTNPPYLSAGKLTDDLKKYLAKEYKEGKSDLFAAFILRCLQYAKPEGYLGFMSPYVWMFISSYEKLRQILINKTTISCLSQLEFHGFAGADVAICTFILKNSPEDTKGTYIRLADFKGHENQGPKTLEAIQNPNCSYDTQPPPATSTKSPAAQSPTGSPPASAKSSKNANHLEV